MTITDFSEGVRTALSGYVAPGPVEFRGSIAGGTFDQWSDVDIEASVERPLDAGLFCGLERLLQDAHGPALVRYDPDYRNTTTEQGIRFSFYELPVFWRVDLIVRSRLDTERKYPHPFPEWSIGTSALMNVIWAVKYHRRERGDDADRYVTAACQKIGLRPVRFTTGSAVSILSELARREDVDSVLLSKTRQAITSAAAYSDEAYRP